MHPSSRLLYLTLFPIDPLIHSWCPTSYGLFYTQTPRWCLKMKIRPRHSLVTQSHSSMPPCIHFSLTVVSYCSWARQNIPYQSLMPVNLFPRLNIQFFFSDLCSHQEVPWSQYLFRVDEMGDLSLTSSFFSTWCPV